MLWTRNDANFSCTCAAGGGGGGESGGRGGGGGGQAGGGVKTKGGLTEKGTRRRAVGRRITLGANKRATFRHSARAGPALILPRYIRGLSRGA